MSIGIEILVLLTLTLVFSTSFEYTYNKKLSTVSMSSYSALRNCPTYLLQMWIGHYGITLGRTLKRWTCLVHACALRTCSNYYTISESFQHPTGNSTRLVLKKTVILIFLFRCIDMSACVCWWRHIFEWLTLILFVQLFNRNLEKDGI